MHIFNLGEEASAYWHRSDKNDDEAYLKPAEKKGGGQVRTIKVFLMASVAAPLMVAPALASETLIYSYDALGRLTTVAHSGTVNSGQQAAYAIDLADNRTGVTVTGAASPVIVVPLNGFTVIPLGFH